MGLYRIGGNMWSEQDWDFEGLMPFVAGQRRPIVDVELPEEDVKRGVPNIQQSTCKSLGDS